MASNFDMLKKRLQYNGGIKQEDRMIKGKYKTFLKALDSSYLACYASLMFPSVVSTEHHVLINPNKLTLDYDDKILSADFQCGFAQGNIIKWKETNTYWLVYLRALTEDAYFRANLRRCRYLIKIDDLTIYAAVRGPKENGLNTSQTHLTSVDTPNLTLELLLPRTDATVAYFKRYNRFFLQGKTTCWRVEGMDEISIEGILQISAKEYYYNKDTDDIDEGTVDTLIELVEEDTTNEIKGDTLIKPHMPVVYEYTGESSGTWSCDHKYVSYTVLDNGKITIQWNSNLSGSFKLCYGTSEKTITVLSLF